MRTILLLTPDSGLVEKFRLALPDYGLLWLPRVDGALAATQRSHVDACVWALGPESADAWQGFVNHLGYTAPDIGVIRVGDDGQVSPPPMFRLSWKASSDEIRAVVSAAIEYRIGSVLERTRAVGGKPQAEEPRESSPGAVTRVLTEFSRAFVSALEPSRALDAFLNAVSDLVRPARSGVFLRNTETSGFTLAASRRLTAPPDATIAFNSRLAQWLTREGRPASIALVPSDVAAEVTRFSAVLALPLIADGHLLGFLVLGPPVVRDAYADSDLEVLFELGMHLALALRAAEFHHELQDQKRLAESVLTHMASGIVTLGRDERILAVNHRAAEILGVDAEKVRGAGIRALPSPLGDLLVAALNSASTRQELQIPGTSTWVAIAAVPVPGDGAPRAAVLTLEDITAQRALAERRRASEQMQLLNAIVSRVADEIKNPLVSVRIFSELLPDRYDDADFRKEFRAVVGRDVQRLVRVLGTLTALAAPSDPSPHPLDLNAVVEEVAREAAGQLAFDAVQVNVETSDKPVAVAADRGQLTYALTMLVDFLASHSPAGTRNIKLSVNRGDSEHIIVKLESPTAAVPTEQLYALFDPLEMVHQGLRDVGPAVASRIADAFGGSLRCDQERSAIVFRLSLPIHA